MSEVRPYTVTVNGRTTHLRLSEEDAAAYGDAATPTVKADGSTGAQPPVPDTKARTVANKNRTVTDK